MAKLRFTNKEPKGAPMRLKEVAYIEKHKTNDKRKPQYKQLFIASLAGHAIVLVYAIIKAWALNP